jgi:hypothetical protein
MVPLQNIGDCQATMKGTFGLGYKSQKYKLIHHNFPKIRSKLISPETHFNMANFVQGLWISLKDDTIA